MFPNIILYAPNVHTGGGLVLLKSLLKSWQKSQLLMVILDDRCREELSSVINENINVIQWVKPTLLSRFKAELTLRHAAKTFSTVFCFHNIPPILCKPTKTIIFFQNRLLLDSLSKISFFSKLFFINLIERLILKMCNSKNNEFIVQTSSMKNLFIKKNLSVKKITVLPFFELALFPESRISNKKNYDFVYISSNEKHKNHMKLLDAWTILGENNIIKSLVVTVNPNDINLIDKINKFNSKFGNAIVNLGNIKYDEILKLYENTNALIFPSIAESFGLPLIEASSLNLPILASELDYVRDVCNPVETFNPNSSLSIARAVKRFLKIESQNQIILSPTEFWQSIIDIYPQSDLKTQTNLKSPLDLARPQ